MNTIESRMIEANGLSFHCLTAGEAGRPLILFLHGFPEYSGAWEEMLTRLSDDYFCVAPDQRGYNLSAKPEGVKAYVAGKLAGDAAAILTHFAPRARAVVGHDWGASVSYALSFARPDLFHRLVILNGAHPIPFARALASGGPQSASSQYFHYLRAEEAEARLSANNYEKMAAFFAAGMEMAWLTEARLDAYRGAWSQPGALTGMVNWYRATPLQVAKPGEPLEGQPALDPAKLRVRMPHLLIWGMQDKALLPVAFEGLEEVCEDLTVRRVEDADHWIIHQKPDECAAMIRDFLA